MGWDGLGGVDYFQTVDLRLLSLSESTNSPAGVNVERPHLDGRRFPVALPGAGPLSCWVVP